MMAPESSLSANCGIFSSLSGRFSRWAELVKLSHTVFALPFALIMLVVIFRTRTIAATELLSILVAVASARTAAMAFNRFIDADIDGENPRTAGREIPTGRVSKAEALLLVVGASLIFLTASFSLGLHCLLVAPAVLAVLLGYSLFKRFSLLCHAVLGVALACAPGGVWYALTATWSWKPVPLMVAVLCWVAGFDILYSCQDAEFDRVKGLYSVPRSLGISGAVRVSAMLHMISLPFLILFGVEFKLGVLYFCGVMLFGAILVSQYITIRHRGIGCIDVVFFTRNGLASVMLFCFTLMDVLFA